VALSRNLLHCSAGKSSSRLILVLWPAMRMERLTTGDFISAPPPQNPAPIGTGWSGVLVSQKGPRLGAPGMDSNSERGRLFLGNPPKKGPREGGAKWL
jgi:hypothetical protein